MEKRTALQNILVFIITALAYAKLSSQDLAGAMPTVKEGIFRPNPNVMLASLRSPFGSGQALTWKRVQPENGNSLDGPILYQIIFRSSAHIGSIPKIGSTYTLVDSGLLLDSGGNLVIGGLVINGTTGVVTFPPQQSTGNGTQTFWSLGGNTGTTPGTNRLGTNDNQPLEFWVNSRRAYRIEPAVSAVTNLISPNVIGGLSGSVGTFSDGNGATTGVAGATIAGGGAGPTTSGLPFIAAFNRVTDDFGTIGGGLDNQVGDDAGTTGDAVAATVAGGRKNTARGRDSTVGGGFHNGAAGAGSVVSGGTSNGAGGDSSTVGGGLGNVAFGPYSVVAGGYGNKAKGEKATIAGGGVTDITDLTTANLVTDDFGTVGGGGNNQAGDNAGTTSDRSYATVAGGHKNTASGAESFVGSGFGNVANGADSTIVGGNSNTANGADAAVGGGTSNNASAASSTISGGFDNIADGVASTVSGGIGNTASGLSSTVAGGQDNSATGNQSFAAGCGADTNHKAGAFVWGDSTCGAVTATLANQFVVRASGGASLFTNSILTTGVTVAAGSGSWASVSDRNVKEHFASIDSQQLLAGVLALPITTWNYKSQAAAIRHIGPMAQDFFASFDLGEDDKHITTIDEGGVALAAIQGLNQKLEEQIRQKEAVIAAQQKQIESFAQQMHALLKRVEHLEGRLGR